jgi:serine/threonine protein kinase/tetratricopeptide (TPR) repeat protein
MDVQDNPPDGCRISQPSTMKCPSCGVENSAVAPRCSDCGKVFLRPEDRTFENVDPEILRESQGKPKDAGPRLPGGAGGGGTVPGGGGGTRSQSEKWRDSQVISKTPSGFGRNDQFSQGDMEAGTLYGGGNNSLPEPAITPGFSGSRRGSGGASFNISGGLEPGMDFGPRFRIEQLLGEGGMGKVYKAVDKELGRTVALKILQPELTKDPNVILRFKQELLLASKISHRNILRIHDLSEFDGVKFITMAFIEGRDLNQILKEEPRFSIERSMKIGRQLCDALDAAHHEGVVHRDFKPHNVLMGLNDHVYVSDFGLATSLETAKMGMTRTGAFVGTPRYMSPEQVEGKVVDHRSDLYSLGLVLYEMVAGEVPFNGDSTWQVMYQRVKDAPKDVKIANPSVPDNVARIIMHCLEREPSERYQSAKEIITDIDAHRAPEMSTSSMYRKPNASSISASRTVQFTVPERAPLWVYIGGGTLVLATLFFAIPKTRNLVFHDSTNNTAVSTVSGLPSLSQGKYLAVLPLQTLGDQSQLGYLAEGIEEALSAKLFQLQGIHVTSAEAAEKVDQKLPLPKIARALGANLVVQGMIQGSGDKVRIILHLEDVANGKRIWSKEFDGVAADIFTLEDQIYNQLVPALGVNPTHDEEAKAEARPTDNIAAYDLYLRGRNAMRGADTKSMESAMDFFTQALKQDRSFALAYTGIADAGLQMYDIKKDPFWTQKALAAAQQGQQLNDNLPEVHSTLGAVYSKLGKNAEAIAELKRAITLAPTSDLGYRRLGIAYLASGRNDQAIETFKKAIELNPYYWGNQTQLGNAYYTLGDYPKALEAFQQVVVLAPDLDVGYQNIGNIYVAQGKYQEAVPFFQKCLQIQPYWSTYSNLGTAYFFLKQFPKAVEMFEKAVELNPNDTATTVNLADGYRAAGQQDKALATYQKAISAGFKELETNPQNADVMDQIALSYAKTGKAKEADGFIVRARAIDKKNVNYMYDQARINALVGKTKEALKSLHEAIDSQFPCQYAAQDPDLENIRGTEEFKSMMAKCSTSKP